jgi:hypothetical protein
LLASHPCQGAGATTRITRTNQHKPSQPFDSDAGSHSNETENRTIIPFLCGFRDMQGLAFLALARGAGAATRMAPAIHRKPLDNDAGLHSNKTNNQCSTPPRGGRLKNNREIEGLSGQKWPRFIAKIKHNQRRQVVPRRNAARACSLRRPPTCQLKFLLLPERLVRPTPLYIIMELSIFMSRGACHQAVVIAAARSLTP